MSNPKLPLVLPSGTMLMQMRARRRHEIMDTAFEMSGGVERLVHEMRTPDGFWEGMKLWGKGIARPPSTVEHNFGDSTEEMVDELERSERAQVINPDGTPVDD